MSLKVIELNDRAISVGDETGILMQSPGFALADDKLLVLGEQAEQQARLQPTKSYNKYWHDLNLDPLDHGNNFRHYADVAFAHLQHLAEEAELSSDVILSVPGNFTRQQLSILLGLTQHSPFNVVGVVDSALAATIASSQAQNILYADLQLHQVVLTSLKVANGHVQTGSTVQIPGVGKENFMDLMMQLATTMFIQQCRFNPQHDAQSEQQLYNELPNWIAQSADGNLILELKAGDNVHVAKMPFESLVSSLGGHFAKVNEQVAAMATERDTQVFVNSALAALPGFKSNFSGGGEVVVVDPRVINDNCLSYRDLITGNEQGIQLVKSLPRSGEVATPSASDPTGEIPTHVLVGHKALKVNALRIENHQVLNGSAEMPGTLALSIAGLPEFVGAIESRSDGVYLDTGDVAFLVNGQSSQGEQKLHCGDKVQFAGSDEVLTLIQVRDE